MKTKTNSFTKVINFCVLALFFISTLIIFTSCDNGNSPNDNINQQQNNNSQTDYCEICDGLQTENCGIKHKCDDENCVEYSDNRIYKNGHTHDYCNEDGCLLNDSVRHTTHDYCPEDDCNGSTHMGTDHPTGPTYPEWFKETTIGGEGSPYRALCIDSIKYNEANPYTTEVERFNNYQNQYKSFIEGLEFSDEFIKQFPEIKNINFAEFAEYNVNDKISYKESFDQLINNINNASTNAVIEVTKNIGISGNNALDKAQFKYFYWAIENYIFDIASNGCNKTQSEAEKNDDNGIIKSWEAAHTNRGLVVPFNLYITENGTTSLNPQIFDEMDKMVNAAVERFKNQGISVTKEDIHNILNLSFTASSIEGMHDYLSSVTHTHTDECYNNEMVDVIGDVKVDEMTTIAQAKLNKTIFSHDYGRELV